MTYNTDLNVTRAETCKTQSLSSRAGKLLINMSMEESASAIKWAYAHHRKHGRELCGSKKGAWAPGGTEDCGKGRQKPEEVEREASRT